MGTKTVRLADEVYELVKERKREDESFSDAIGRLIEPPPLSELAGILDEDEADEWRAAIAESRRADIERREGLFEQSNAP